MAPTKATTKSIVPSLNARVTTRSKTHMNSLLKGKRKADGSPSKENAVKRSALGDVTNAARVIDPITKAKKIAIRPVASKPNVAKKVTVQSQDLPSIRTVLKPRQNENIQPPAAPVNKVKTRASLRIETVVSDQTAQKPKEVVKDVTETVVNKVKTRLSNEFEKTEESLYSTALEDSILSLQSSTGSKKKTNAETGIEKMSVSLVASQMEKHLILDSYNVPEGVIDFDKENWDDVHQISNYAMDIFNYLKSREPIFVPIDYMPKQTTLTRWMRSLLVDWMVEIQENFELNHETLYLGVKLVDLYLSKTLISKEMVQLVGAAAIFIASKYDERVPPAVDDFLYICDGAYTRKQLLRMEISILKMVGFDLGIPLSYRFLRRYARCSKVSMPILTLARYILEHSLMDYDTIRVSDSKLAAASLYIALQMKQHSSWTKTLEYYTGYKLADIRPVVELLNAGLHRKPKEQLKTVRTKYSHKIFFEVAKMPLVRTEDLK